VSVKHPLHRSRDDDDEAFDVSSSRGSAPSRKRVVLLDSVASAHSAWLAERSWFAATQRQRIEGHLRRSPSAFEAARRVAVGTGFRPSVTKRSPRNHWSCSCTVFAVPKTKARRSSAAEVDRATSGPKKPGNNQVSGCTRTSRTGNTERCKRWRTGMRVRHGERLRRHNLRGSTLVRASSKDDARGNWGAEEARID